MNMIGWKQNKRREQLKRDYHAMLYGASPQTTQAMTSAYGPTSSATKDIQEIANILGLSVSMAASLASYITRFLFLGKTPDEIAMILKESSDFQPDEADVIIAAAMGYTLDQYLEWTYGLIIGIVKDARDKFLLKNDIEQLEKALAERSKTVDQDAVKRLEQTDFGTEMFNRLGMKENISPVSPGNIYPSTPSVSSKPATLAIISIKELYDSWEYVDRQRDALNQAITNARETLVGDSSYHEKLRMTRSAAIEYLHGTDNLLLQAEAIARSDNNSIANAAMGQGVANAAR